MLTVASEALLVSAVASLLGIAFSLALGNLLNDFYAQEYGLESLYAVDPGLFLLVIGLALGLGVGAAYLPARQATRVDPAEVLREA